MRVIGIDPGYDRLGVAILDGNASKQTLVFSTCIVTDKKLPFSERLATVGTRLGAIIDEYAPECLGIETLFFNKNVKTALLVAQARGVILYTAETRKIAIHEYSPQAIKIAITGHGASPKEHVEMMLPKLIANIPASALDDEYDAIAVGVTCLATLKSA